MTLGNPKYVLQLCQKMYWLCVLAVIMELAFNIQRLVSDPQTNPIEVNQASGKIKLPPQVWISSRRVERLQSGILSETARFLLYNAGDGALLTYRAAKVSNCFFRTESVTSSNDFFRADNDYLLVSIHQNLQYFTSVVWKATSKGPAVLIEPAPPWDSIRIKTKAAVATEVARSNNKQVRMSAVHNTSVTAAIAKNLPRLAPIPPSSQWQFPNKVFYKTPEKGLKNSEADELYANSRNQYLQRRQQDTLLEEFNGAKCPTIEWSFVWGVVSSSLYNNSKHRYYQIRNFSGDCLKSGATFVPCRLPNPLVIFEILLLNL